MGDANIARPLDRMHNGRVAKLDSQGYVQVFEPEHPRADSGGWVFEHRIIVEKQLGRHLRREENVHHVNGVKHDNRLENLVVMGHEEHLDLTRKNHVQAMDALRAELAEYRRRYGPLERSSE